VLRSQVTWTHRTQVDALALRSLTSVGIDALGATTYGDHNLADGRFVSWLAQAQWAHALPHALRDSQLVVRGDLQLTTEPLFSFERFAIGGMTTVRGYRENQLVTDDGAIGSVEVRVPLWRDGLGRHRVEIVPFMDVGYGWNDGADPEDNLLWSCGIGLRVQPIDHAFGEVWWGGRLEDVNDPKHHDLQDDGMNVRARVDVP
jgi:hemolysin activation/secretion protein